MSQFDDNPFGPPTVDNPFADPSVQQVTKQTSSVQRGLEEFNPFADQPSQATTNVRGAANPPDYNTRQPQPAVMAVTHEEPPPNYNRTVPQNPQNMTPADFQIKMEESSENYQEGHLLTEDSSSSNKKTASEIEKIEEVKFQEKYPQAIGKRLAGHSSFLQKKLAKGQKYFDSGDYQMAKQNLPNKRQGLASNLFNIHVGEAIPTPETVPVRKSSIIQPKFLVPAAPPAHPTTSKFS